MSGMKTISSQLWVPIFVYAIQDSILDAGCVKCGNSSWESEKFCSENLFQAVQRRL